MKIAKAKLRSIIQEELTRALNEQDNKRAKMATQRAVVIIQDMWNFVTDEAGGEQKAIELLKSATKSVSSNIGQAILKMFKEGEGQIQEGLLDFFKSSTINTLKKMGEKLVRDLRIMALADRDRPRRIDDTEERMETALNGVLKAANIPSKAQSAVRALIASVGTL
jgi:hypothetical protein